MSGTGVLSIVRSSARRSRNCASTNIFVAFSAGSSVRAMTNTELLTSDQDAVLRALGRDALARTVYWTGGTLLAARYFQHRRSLDLDIFSEDLLEARGVDVAVRRIVRETHARGFRFIRYPSRTEYYLRFPERELRVDVAYFPFPPLGRRVRWHQYGLAIDSLRDIVANKVHAITERNEPKDVFDLYTILRAKQWTLKRIFADVAKKFGGDVDPVHFGARVLAGIDDMDRLRPLLPPDAPPAKAIRAFFDGEARKILRRQARWKGTW